MNKKEKMQALIASKKSSGKVKHKTTAITAATSRWVRYK